MMMMTARRAGSVGVLARGIDAAGRTRHAVQGRIVGVLKNIIVITMAEPARGRRKLRARLTDGITTSRSGLSTTYADRPIAALATASAQRTAGVAALRNRGAHNGNALRPGDVGGRAARTVGDDRRLGGVGCAGIKRLAEPAECRGGGAGPRGHAVIVKPVVIVISSTSPGRAS